MTKYVSNRKKTGATFTPESLAEFLSEKILQHYHIDNGNVCVLDPACGDGILLSTINKKTGNILSNIIGYDTNEISLKNASRKINHTHNIGQFIHDDFLTVCPTNIDLFKENIKYSFADIIIANPPYVRTQILGVEKTKQLARDFDIKGRIDLYYPFFMAMTNALKVGGILGVITSNRYICTKSGSDIRRFLLNNYEIIEIIDLGDTKLFDAAVLPAIFIGIKKKKNIPQTTPILYSSIYECATKSLEPTKVSSIFDILHTHKSGLYKVNDICYNYKVGYLEKSKDKSTIWQQKCSTDNNWIEIIDSNFSFKIKDRFKVRVGIKSCADNVFITQQWKKLGVEIEPDLLCPMLSQENIDTWRIDRQSMIDVLYPHYCVNGKKMVYDLSRYPNAKSYLELYREQLEKRSYLIKAKRTWYEYWVPQNPCNWKKPKIVFPDISVKPRFCFDDTGAIVNGNCYWICADNEVEEELLYLIEGVCNSSILTKYHDAKFTNKLYSGRRRYLSQYVEEYPIPNPSDTYSRQIIQLVKKINKLSNKEDIAKFAKDIDLLVEKAFGIRD